MQLKGKTIDFLGDSITDGCCVVDFYNRYDNILKRDLELLEVYNHGLGGSRLAYQSEFKDNPSLDPCFCERAKLLNKNADIVVVFGGINDYLHGDAPFGTEEDDGPETFCGAVNYLMAYLKKEFEGKTIVFMTPAHCCCWGFSDKDVSTHPAKKEDAKPLKPYVDIIVKRGMVHNIPVINLFDDLGLDLNDECTRNEYAPDGLHFNDKGQYFIAKVLGDFLQKI